MPARTLTVVLNSNHSKKFALVFRSPSSESPKDTVLREARNKFRNKALSQIFLQGGSLLEDELHDSVTSLWVSKGEPYSGPPEDPFLFCNPGEIRIIADKSYVDEKAVKQLELVATLPGVQLAIGMPDLHPGNRFPVGCAIACEGIYPALIGSDVGCGIALYNLSPPSRSSPNPNKLAGLLRGLDEPWDGSVTAWLALYGIERSSEYDEGSLGTVGAGNHFAEIVSVERIVDEEAAERLGILEGALYLLVHTGSRGLGASILASETAANSNPYIPSHSPHLAEYLAEHDYAVAWAIANRDLVALRIKRCMYPSSNEQFGGTPDPNELGKILDVTHNSVTQHIFTPGEQTKVLWVHRKGAAPTDKGIAPCPGSRGDFSWLLEPLGDGQYNAYSLAHGAGRRHPRQSLHNLDSKLSKSVLTKTGFGSEVICTDQKLLLEERPEAYKDVGCVVDDMAEKQICRGIVVLRPVVTYKIREHGQGRK